MLTGWGLVSLITKALLALPGKLWHKLRGDE